MNEEEFQEKVDETLDAVCSCDDGSYCGASAQAHPRVGHADQEAIGGHMTFNSFATEYLPHHYKAVYDPLGRSYVIDPEGKIRWSSQELVELDVCWSGAFAFKVSA